MTWSFRNNWRVTKTYKDDDAYIVYLAEFMVSRINGRWGVRIALLGFAVEALLA